VPSPRPEVDEWSFLGRVARWAALLAVATVVAVMVLLLAAPRAEPVEPVRGGPHGVPGGAGFCLTPDGWVSCQLVEERLP
jgi:hypothetical protein